MKVKELIQLLNDLSDEDKELEIAVDHQVMINCTITGLAHIDYSDYSEEFLKFLKSRNVPKKLIYISNNGI